MTHPVHVVGVVSDLHANARALRAALADVDARGVDELVILGDLLTYGLDDEEVLDLVEARIARGASLVLGNHDQLYLDLAAGDRAYYDGLPAWLRESVDRAAARLDAARFRALPFLDGLARGGWWLSHANPFGARDWRYLNAEGEVREAADALRSAGRAGGVFGHTHRRAAWSVAAGGAALAHPDAFAADDPAAVWVVNPGSVGQPRQGDRATTWLRLSLGGGGARGELRAVGWDVAAHRAALLASGLTEVTARRLAAFFGEP